MGLSRAPVTFWGGCRPHIRHGGKMEPGTVAFYIETRIFNVLDDVDPRVSTITEAQRRKRHDAAFAFIATLHRIDAALGAACTRFHRELTLVRCINGEPNDPWFQAHPWHATNAESTKLKAQLEVQKSQLRESNEKLMALELYFILFKLRTK